MEQLALVVPSRVTVWYDGGCPLCVREIALMQRLDKAKRLHLVDVDNPDAACPVDRKLALARLHVLENGKLLSGAAAFAAMWRVIPQLRWLGLAAQVPPVGWALEGAYRAFLIVRPAVQQLFKVLLR
jgi:predicted DCC family thiol-disulfide oxidoreductase YuxK